ncbi:hypothetical protein GCM10022236_08350 [Microlunatus ginsengisoli]|uniref:Uncharacterized protein n=1 Tax=Microlunatus ginsengisoli TaxID=363863 RepID=A0ABP6ZHP0_9ACTN
MLIVGTVCSLACVLGPVWLARLGLVPALGAAFVSCWLAWREIGLERRAHAAAMLSASRRHGAQLSEERRHNTAVLTAMSGRLEASNTLAVSRGATIHQLRHEIARLNGDVNGLRGANGRLTRDLNFRNAAIAELRETIAERESELAALLAAAEDAATDCAQDAATRRGEAEADITSAPDAEIHRLPSRAVGTHATTDVPVEQALGDDGAERRNAAYLAADAAIAMPNYEEDRRLG